MNFIQKLSTYLFTVSLVTLSNPAFSATKMVISQADGYVTHKLAASVIAEAYRKLNIETSFIQLPSKRSMIFANIGKVDAEVGRVAKALDDLPNLLKVDIPLTHVKGVAVVKDIECKCTQWSDIKDLRIGIRRGEVFAEKATAGMSVFPTSSYHQLFSMLQQGRIDVAVGIYSAIDLELNYAFKNQGMKIVGAPLIEFPLYHLIHKKHKSLVPKLNKVLAEMIASGEVEELHNKTRANIFIERSAGEKRIKVFK